MAIKALEKSPQYETSKKEILDKQKAAQEHLNSIQPEVDRLKKELAEAERQFDQSSREVRLVRSYRDKARADYDLGVRDGLKQSDLDKLQRDFDAKQARVAAAELDAEQKQTARDEIQIKLKGLTKSEDDETVALGKLNGDLDLREKALEKLDPEGFSAFKKRIMEWPIIDGFNSPLKITQDWLPNLSIQLGMARTARFDRCRTCHGAIERVEAGNVPSFPFGHPGTSKVSDWVLQNKYPHPFATHPNPNLYLTSASPHPLGKFGCTICHDGQGSATSFKDASHTPNDPYESEVWHEKLHYNSNHFWEYPMQPERLRESTCIKCHHSVVELGVHPKFGASAPKVFRGYNLIKEFGCFGCHEIQGFDGTRPIGPDLRLEPSTEADAARIAADPMQVAGTLRKVGPSLRHIKTKLTGQFVSYWVEDPQRFRPTTRMPRFFHTLRDKDTKKSDPHEWPDDLAESVDETAKEFQPVELIGIAHYLLAQSEPLDLLQPAKGYRADAKRGKDLFSKRGCLACHSHGAFPDSHATFGPDLTQVHAKVRPGTDGFRWTYSWIRDPQRYHKRSRMPNLFVEPYEEGGKQIDPAADIAAFLLAGGAQKFALPKYDDPALDKLVKLYLSKALRAEQVAGILAVEVEPKHRHRYPVLPAEVKGDEVELIGDPSKPITEEQWRGMKLNYIGRRTISRYGCYGCHDIPNFETARPIGTALQDWGRKDTSRLAPEHIEEYLEGHGEPNGGSTHERVVEAMKAAQAGGAKTGEFKGDEQQRQMRTAYFYNDLLHHGRAGFLWQKLRDPRSYDYLKTDTKGYDERLRMPKFPFNEEDIEAISTFVLGLVADPPGKDYIYHADGPAKARIEGERMIDRYNCSGCHMLQLPEIQYTVDPKELAATAITPSDYPAGVDLLLKLKPPERAETGRTQKVKTDAGEKELPVIGFHGLVYSRPEADAAPDEREYTYDLWSTLDVGGKKILPQARMLVTASRLVPGASAKDGYSTLPRGGTFAEWLVESLIKQGLARSIAWQMSPPPLYKEGLKVQTPWLYQFLRDPYRLRHTTVLRMPRFNMSAEEAQTLANYFAAVDNEPFPYQQIPQREPDYLAAKEQQLKRLLEPKKTHYLAESWKVLNAPLCVKCHSVGGREFKALDPTKDIRGPNLEYAADRLRPDWLMVWLYKPAWITPYTSMPQPLPRDAKNFEELFGGDASVQTVALRDALMNYHRLMEQEGKAVVENPAPQKAEVSAASTTRRAE
ncbi:MAG TPA: c-type cytochrome [Planctomycetaceae bacterium]|nr:c-type cytochrome [Planctomycetaceae bacterium]